MRSDFAVPGVWVEAAECRGAIASMEMPQVRHSTDRAHIERARVVCARCPVRDDCLAWALTEPDPAVGMIAGGYTPQERARIRNGIAPARWPRIRLVSQ